MQTKKAATPLSRTPHTATNFRALHAGKTFVIPNPWDVGGARILASLGFAALATTSAGLAFSLGVREGEVTRAQTLQHCRDIVAATDLPVSADLERGFGDSPQSAAETIIAAADCRLAGCSIEDYSGDPNRPIYDFDLAVARVASAADACRRLSHDFVFTARAENFLWGRPDLADTIARLRAFEDAGADVLYAPGLPDLQSIRAVCSALSKPVNVVMGMPGTTYHLNDLHDAGVTRVSIGSAFARLAYGELVRAATEIRDQQTFAFAEHAMGFAALEKLLDADVG